MPDCEPAVPEHSLPSALPAGVPVGARPGGVLAGLGRNGDSHDHSRVTAPVEVRQTQLSLPTYLPAAPDKNPMFLEKRVYQGSSGRVYPLPFTDRIAEQPLDRSWEAVWLENEFLKVLVLPEIGGRIHRLIDKTNGYDLIYYNPVIKPALVGLAGPWISGGIEFNWPQHHRPGTFLPVDTSIEREADGSVTVWCSDHDPLVRMKGMHGICLRPGQAVLELKVRACNRTPHTQTFLWWANVATRVHEAYQSFFPPDVHYVADHARRAMSEYPLAQGCYYGVNYGERGRNGVPKSEVPRQFVPPHCGPGSAPRTPPSAVPAYAPNDLSWYANIPTPCSYMCMGSKEDFFGGYDHARQAGLIHVANHHISPGKKQWTWGNHEFGYSWDRNLTDPDAQGGHGPYIEIMAGVYTDNQPDFSFLQPGETKTWSQYWYPIQKIGPALHANLHAAISLAATVRGILRLGVAVTARRTESVIVVQAGKREVARWTKDLAPDAPLVAEFKLPPRIQPTDLRIRVTDQHGTELISCQPRPRVKGRVPPPATEPPAAALIAGNDELYLTGLHLAQYRHATRCPSLYWREALRRDPQDSRCNNALGVWHLQRGEFGVAEKQFRAAIQRQTLRNSNPADGEAHYNLGLCLRYQMPSVPDCARRTALLQDAYDALYKATWNQAWAGAGFHALAEIDCTRGDWTTAREHLLRALRLNTDNLRARNLLVLVLRKLEQQADAAALLRKTLALDPLDWWARQLNGERLTCDLQTHLDLAHDYARAGFYLEAIELLQGAVSSGDGVHCSPAQAEQAGVRADDQPALLNQSWGARPLVHYTLGWLEQQRGHVRIARAHFKRAAALPPDYCFPARLEEIPILEAARAANPHDARAPYYLGNLLYDRRRHEEAIRCWEKSARLDPRFSVVWRNLGIGYFNIRQQPAKARAAYERAFRANPADGRLLYERDQLWKRLGESPANRLRELERHPRLIARRDDLSLELCALYNQVGRHEEALKRVSSRNFQPWEGGEGGPLGQWVRSHLALGRAALDTGDASAARTHFEAALTAPLNLGEARHLLANQSDIHYWLGCALAALGEPEPARQHWLAAATFKGDFQEMSVRAFSELTFYSALAWERLGQQARANKLLRELLGHARTLAKTPAKIDYFATSLPAMLLFDDDLQRRQETAALFLEAQARLGLGQKLRARRLLGQVLKRDPNHALAADLLSGLAGSKSRAVSPRIQLNREVQRTVAPAGRLPGSAHERGRPPA